ncbi:MAG TPA: ABC transporter ATP-binding protein, partial [Rhodobacteraceae bacterium]|nr:ABC transporter ATP-binding protein [Paracoccaceae bacterium]
MDIDIRSKFFGTQQVLGKISLSAAIGEVIAVTGPSGIGKSTFV